MAPFVSAPCGSTSVCGWRTAAALHSLKCQQPQRLCDDEAVGCKKASGRAWPADDLVIFHLFDQLINALLPAPRFVGETIVDHRLAFVAEAEGQRRLCAEQSLPQSIRHLYGKPQVPISISAALSTAVRWERSGSFLGSSRKVRLSTFCICGRSNEALSLSESPGLIYVTSKVSLLPLWAPSSRHSAWLGNTK